MSFSHEAKDALCVTAPKKFCCKLALLYGYFYGGTVFGEERIVITFSTQTVRNYIAALFFDVFSIELEQDEKIEINDAYTLGVIFDILNTDNSAEISDILYTCENCSQSFLKGLFLSCATMTDPAKSYEIAFTGLDRERAREVENLFALQGLPIGVSTRRGHPVLYYKSAPVIERLLSYIGASKALFGVLNAKMIGEERNAINRRTNFESANLGRTVLAASEQIAAVSKLQDAGILPTMSAQLQETARLRVEYPDVSLAELAALHEPPITKSGLTHRLKKIVELSKEEA